MNIEIITKLDEITTLIKKDKLLNEKKQLEKELQEDKQLLSDISKLKELSTYDESYLELKNKILSNKKYKRYKELEKDTYIFTREINEKLNCFTEKSGCK